MWFPKFTSLSWGLWRDWYNGNEASACSVSAPNQYCHEAVFTCDMWNTMLSTILKFQRHTHTNQKNPSSTGRRDYVYCCERKTHYICPETASLVAQVKMTAELSGKGHRLDCTELSTCLFTLLQSICISYLTWLSSFTGDGTGEIDKKQEMLHI